MIKLEKRLEQWCEDCEMFAPCSMKLRDKQDDNSYAIKAIVMCKNIDICSNAVHQYQKACKNTPIIKENKNHSRDNKAQKEFDNVDFGISDLLMRG